VKVGRAAYRLTALHQARTMKASLIPTEFAVSKRSLATCLAFVALTLSRPLRAEVAKEVAVDDHVAQAKAESAKPDGWTFAASVLDEWQIQNSLLLTFSYSLIDTEAKS
jgi:hypothetical protein